MSKLSIQRKLVWLMTLTSSLALLLASSAFLAYEWSVLRRDMVADLRTQAEIIAANVAGALTFQHAARAAETLQPLRARPHIVAAFILAKDGTALASYVRSGEAEVPPQDPAAESTHRFESGRVALSHPIVFRGEQTGFLCLKSDFQPIYARFKQYAGIAALVLVAGLLAAFWLASILQKVISVPIASLSEITRLVSTRKDYSLRAPKHSEDELGVLIDGFNEMLDQIQQRDAALSQAHEELELRVARRTNQLAEEVAERTRAETALAKEKELLTVTLSSIADGLITTDTQGQIILLNSAAEQLTGWSVSDATGRPCTEVFRVLSVKQAEGPERAVPGVLNTGRVIALPMDSVLLARDGVQRPIAGSAAPVLEKGGGVIGVALAFRDTTADQRLASELLKSSKLESLGLLAGGIAHDFNNILTAILGNISLARMFAEFNSNTQETLGNAERACLRAKELTGQLLTFSKGGLPVKTASSVAELILETGQFVLRGSTVRAEFSLAPDLWPAEVDESQISQVIANVVINAMQAMPTGGLVEIGGRNVRLAASSAIPLPPGEYIHLSIRDYGVGIRPEHLPQIFDPYFTTKQKGNGLGLATSFSIVKRHGGYLSVESVLGAGTTFHLHLPAAPQIALPAPTRPAKLAAGGGRILVMDDEPAIRHLLTRFLKTLNYDPEMASDGAEAIRRYLEARTKGQPFAAVILDLTVPGGMGGKETMAKLKAADPSVTAIVSSGYSADPVMADYKAYGFKGVISKPYQLENLAQTLHDLIDTQNRTVTGH